MTSFTRLWCDYISMMPIQSVKGLKMTKHADVSNFWTCFCCFKCFISHVVRMMTSNSCRGGPKLPKKYSNIKISKVALQLDGCQWIHSRTHTQLECRTQLSLFFHTCILFISMVDLHTVSHILSLQPENCFLLFS